MAFFDTLSKKLSDAGQSVSQQTKNLGEINRLNNLIAENRKGISQRCFELGKAYYQAHHEEENVEFPALVSQIRDRKSTRLNSSHPTTSRMPSSA